MLNSDPGDFVRSVIPYLTRHPESTIAVPVFNALTGDESLVAVDMVETLVPGRLIVLEDGGLFRSIVFQPHRIIDYRSRLIGVVASTILTHL